MWRWHVGDVADTVVVFLATNLPWRPWNMKYLKQSYNDLLYMCWFFARDLVLRTHNQNNSTTELMLIHRSSSNINMSGKRVIGGSFGTWELASKANWPYNCCHPSSLLPCTLPCWVMVDPAKHHGTQVLNTTIPYTLKKWHYKFSKIS